MELRVSKYCLNCGGRFCVSLVVLDDLYLRKQFTLG